MIEFSILRQDLLPALLTVISAVGKKNTNPLLSHILLQLEHNTLRLTTTDLDFEMTALVPCESSHEAHVTVPAKKFLDIIRSLDEKAHPQVQFADATVYIREGRSVFRLATLPPDHFPSIQDETPDLKLHLPRIDFYRIIHSAHFALSQQDVRIFLNCLLIDIEGVTLRAVATDGHRMAIAQLILSSEFPASRFLLTRKIILEILRLIHPLPDDTVTMIAGKKYFKLVTAQYSFTSRLVDSRFPHYLKAIPVQQDKHFLIQRDVLKRVLSRMIILAHEKSHAILLHMQPNTITLVANNQEKEEAIESLEIPTVGDELKIGINAVYLLDVLTYLSDGLVRVSFTHANASILVESVDTATFQYVIMPMKL